MLFKNLPLFFTIFFLSTLTSISAQVEKKVIVEHFTNTRCGICASRNPDFFANLDNHPDVLHIAIHPSAPYSNCLLNNNNPEENDARTNYYGIYGSTPKLVIQGENVAVNADYGDAEIFAPYFGEMSPVSVSTIIDVDADDLLSAYVEVSASADNEIGEVELFVALVEDTVFYDAPNSEDLHFNVFRKRLNEEGQMINVLATQGEGDTYITTGIEVNPDWNLSRLHAIAVLQDPVTKEIIQAAKGTFIMTVETDNLVLQGVEISPNPVQNQLNISLDSNTETELNLIDLTGRTISTNTFQNETQINTSELAKGIYFVELKNEEGRLTQKVVKN